MERGEEGGVTVTDPTLAEGPENMLGYITSPGVGANIPFPLPMDSPVPVNDDCVIPNPSQAPTDWLRLCDVAERAVLSLIGVGSMGILKGTNSPLVTCGSAFNP